MPQTIQEKLAIYYAICNRESARSFSAYLDRVVIDSVPPRRFSLIREPFQTERFSVLAPAIEYAAGVRNSYTGPANFWFGYAKGHDKTSSLARTLNWVLAYSAKNLRCYACAADADQAGLLRDAMDRELKLNPWLRDRVAIGRKVCFGTKTGASLEILAADADSTHGKSPDVLVLDEITHWSGKEFFDAVYSAKNKRPNCLTIILTNAGKRNSWQWDLRTLASSSPYWHFFEQAPGTQLASWMNAARIAEDRKMLTRSEARRLIDNVWIDESEDCGFVDRTQIESCIVPDLIPTAIGTPGRRYWAGVDYGELKDRTALAVIHSDADGSVTVDRLDVWQGSRSNPVPVANVEQWMRDTRRAFPGITFVVDRHQMTGSIQRLRSEGLQIEQWEARGGKANYQLATNLRVLIVERRLRLYRSCGAISHSHNPDVPIPDSDYLPDEIAALITKPMGYGYRIDHESGLHDDRTIAVGMAALFAVQNPSQSPSLIPSSPVPTVTATTLLHERLGEGRNWAAERGLYGMRT